MMKARHFVLMTLISGGLLAASLRHTDLIKASDCVFWKENTECQKNNTFDCLLNNCVAFNSKDGLKYSNLLYHDKDGGTKPEPTLSVSVDCTLEVTCEPRMPPVLDHGCNLRAGSCDIMAPGEDCPSGYEAVEGTIWEKKVDWLDPGICMEE